jgi:hypothetical protein
MIPDDLIAKLDALPIVHLELEHEAVVGYRCQLYIGVDAQDWNDYGEGVGTKPSEAILGALEDASMHHGT